MKSTRHQAENKICRTSHQYSKDEISSEDMAKLVQIAHRYRDVKNYVYRRYGGVKSISKITPGYEIQKELIGEGYREKSGLPSVYFQNALYDALTDMRGDLEKTKQKIRKAIYDNENLSERDGHYLRFVLSLDKTFIAVLEHKPVELSAKFMKPYLEISKEVDAEKLDSYLRRQFRKHHKVLHTDIDTRFYVDSRGYKYGDHGIYLSSIEKMKRIFIPLTDGHSTDRRINVKLNQEKHAVELLVPIDVATRKHDDYINQVGIAIGINTMLTTDGGNVYGEDFGKLNSEYALWVQEKIRNRSRDHGEAAGSKKYDAKKRRMKETLRSYINHEIRRFIETEKPEVIYIPKYPKNRRIGFNKDTNYRLNMWQRGAIIGSLMDRCEKEAVEIIWVYAEGIGTRCSSCGADWTDQSDKKFKGRNISIDGRVKCPYCGAEMPERCNAARNAKLIRYQQDQSTDKYVRTDFTERTVTDL